MIFLQDSKQGVPARARTEFCYNSNGFAKFEGSVAKAAGETT
jgi:hypothetical protein